MSLAEERARDVEEIINDEPVSFKWNDAFYTGKKTAAVPDALGMLDAGYQAESDIGLLVMASQFTQGTPAVHDTINVYLTLAPEQFTGYKIMKVNTVEGYLKLELKELL